MTLLFKIGPRHSAEVLSGVPKCRKAGTCLMQKIHVQDERSGLG